jgi:putative membrane protein
MTGSTGAAASAAVAAAAPIIASMQTDANALALLHESNLAEVRAGERAQREARDPAVRAFAAQMVSDHNALDQQGMTLGQRLGIAPTLPDSTLPQLQERELQALPTGTGASGSGATTGGVTGGTTGAPVTRDSSNAPNPTLPSSGAPTAGTTPVTGDTTSRAPGAMGGMASDFDRAYVAQQVAAHARTLALVDAAVQRAQQAELRTMLESQVRPSVAAHLQTAQQLQQRLGTQ